MAIKQNLIIKDEILNEEYYITGQIGIYREDGYKKDDDYPILKEENNTKRFYLIDLWQVGVDGSERCPYTYDKENDINIIDEDRLDEFVEYAVKYATKDLFKNIKAHIINEIEADEGENVILRRR